MCELAEAVIANVEQQTSRKLSVAKVDIADSEELTTLYGVRIPVLKAVDTSETLDWPFSEADLIQYLSAL